MKMTNKRVLTGGACALWLFAGGAWAAGGGFAQFEAAGSAVNLYSGEGNLVHTLTVSCGENHLEASFPAGSPVSLVLVDEAGQALPDGPCKYELVAAPQADEEALMEADRKGDEKRLGELWEEAQARTRTQTGEFAIVDGQAMAPIEGSAGEQDD